MSASDTMLTMDKFQSNPDYGIVCQKNNDHGRLLPLMDGSVLACLVNDCGYRISVGAEMQASAEALRESGEI